MRLTSWNIVSILIGTGLGMTTNYCQRTQETPRPCTWASSSQEPETRQQVCLTDDHGFYREGWVDTGSDGTQPVCPPVDIHVASVEPDPDIDFTFDGRGCVTGTWLSSATQEAP